MLRTLRDADMLPILIKGLVNCPQNPLFHPEGDAFDHTTYVCNAMRNICERENIRGTHRRILMFAALLHDTGKSITTTAIDKDGFPQWISPGHEIISEQMAQDFLMDFEEFSPLQKEQIARLTRWHMTHCQNHKWTDRAVRRLNNRLAPANMDDLLWLMEADCNGRPPAPGLFTESAYQFAALALRLGFAESYQLLH
jgi:tRNA nucleotidyltransferase (CCA-adding enzyme)